MTKQSTRADIKEHLNEPSTAPSRSESRRDFARRVIGALSLTRVATIGSVSALVTSTGCQGDTSYDASYEPYWAYRANQMEEYQVANFEAVRTEQNPGMWADKIGGHKPSVNVANDVITVKVDHPMSEEHWISTVYLRDLDTERVFYLKEFMPKEKDPGAEKGVTITADLPPEVNRFAAFAYCNLHELWMSDVVQF